MDELSFVYWLRGFFEINNNPEQQLSAQQVQIIKDHLQLVFNKQTPSYSYSIDYKTQDSITISPNVFYPFSPHSC